jgi:AraC-like DNA-binding protein
MTDSPPPPRRARWTPAKQRIFLVALHDAGCVAAAAQAAGMSRSSAHRLRQRLAGTPFVRTWDSVLADHRRRLADPFAPTAQASPPPGAPAPRAVPPAVRPSR